MTAEKIIVGKGTAFPLNGLLTLPEGDGPFPAAVLVHGSGSSDMNEQVLGLTPFKDIAEGLAGLGVAAIRYDKRSKAYPLKMIKDKPVTVYKETIEDAIRAANLLRQDKRIDPDRIFIIGHSMGAMLAPRIDAEGGNFRGLILMAGTLRDMGDVVIGQLTASVAASKGILGSIMQKQLKKYTGVFTSLPGLSDEQALQKKYGGGVTLYYFKEMAAHPGEEYLKNTHKPIFILQGEKDFQVLADVDYPLYRNLLGDRDNVRFALYEGLNHCFVKSDGYGILNAKKEYKRPRPVEKT